MDMVHVPEIGTGSSTGANGGEFMTRTRTGFHPMKTRTGKQQYHKKAMVLLIHGTLDTLDTLRIPACFTEEYQEYQ